MSKRGLLFFCLSLLASVSAVQAASPEAGLALARASTQAWPAGYLITLDVPPDHHAYLDQGDENSYIAIELDPEQTLVTSGLVIDRLEKAEGVYDSEVKATVLRGRGAFKVWLDRAATYAGDVSASVPMPLRYQLCNEITHVCFRPKITSITLPLPEVGVPATTALNIVTNDAAYADDLSLGERLMKLFKDNQDNAVALFGLMLLAGLLSVATPCVYPMLPITSMLILKRANGQLQRKKFHALAYITGIICTYAMLGLLAGMTGGAFNTLMQSAYVNLAFAALFAWFALSLLGFYELSFMQDEVYSLDRQSAKVNGLRGTWLMGSVAGLVISPCVGPIVFALLLQVADNMAAQADALTLTHQAFGFWDKLAIAGRGSLMMSGFGLGVGLPFFIISVIKLKKMPKSGVWMDKVKYAFGFAILYIAYVYFDKGMGVMGVEHSSTVLLVWGMIALWVAIVHFNVLSLLPAGAAPVDKLYRYCGVLSLLVGGWLVAGSLNRMPVSVIHANNSQPAARQNPGATIATVEKEAGIIWYRNFAEAKVAAQASGKPIFIDFYASWCANCVAFKKKAANHPKLNQALRTQAIALKLVDQEPNFEVFRNHPQHRSLKIGLPYFVILTPDGQIQWSGTDYQAVDRMVLELKCIGKQPTIPSYSDEPSLISSS